MTIVDLTEIKNEQKILKSKLKQLKYDEKELRKTQIDKFIIENRTHNCNCGDEDDLETDPTSCDVQCLMFSNGYVLDYDGDMEWYKPKDIKNYKERMENGEVRHYPDFDDVHVSEGCLKNYEQLHVLMKKIQYYGGTGSAI